MTEPIQRPREPRTIAEAAEPHIPRLMAGLMSRDWTRVRSAVVSTASEYLATHDLSLGAAKAVSMLHLNEEQGVLIAALLAAFEHEGLFSE